jgi:hypothetical protein
VYCIHPENSHEVSTDTKPNALMISMELNFENKETHDFSHILLNNLCNIYDFHQNVDIAVYFVSFNCILDDFCDY